MNRTKWISTCLVAAVFGVVGGYLVGGLIYEAAGDHVWREPLNLIYWYQTLIAGVVAAVAAVYAARRAWLAVLQQIHADDERRKVEIGARDVALCNTMSISLGLAAFQVGALPIEPIEAHLVDQAALLVQNAMAVDIRLGVALAAWVGHAKLNDRAARPLAGDFGRPDQDFADRFVRRTQVLDAAFMTAGVDIETQGIVRADALVSIEELTRAGFTANPNDPLLGWAGILARPRTVPA